jgi:hypothetical protein
MLDDLARGTLGSLEVADAQRGSECRDTLGQWWRLPTAVDALSGWS